MPKVNKIYDSTNCIPSISRRSEYREKIDVWLPNNTGLEIEGWEIFRVIIISLDKDNDINFDYIVEKIKEYFKISLSKIAVSEIYKAFITIKELINKKGEV
jgi:hypothetical protein